MNEDAIRSWVEEELKTNQDVIEDLSGDQRHELMQDNSFVMVYLCKYQILEQFIIPRCCRCTGLSLP